MPDKREEFADLLLKCHRDLFGFIYALLQNLEDANDVYQETAVVLWEKFDDFVPGTNFSAWAMRIAHFRVLKFADAKRKQRSMFASQMIDSLADAYQRDASRQGNPRAEALAGCLEKLTDRERRLIKRCYAPGRNYEEIARSEGRTVGALYQAVNRIRKALFACIERSIAMESRS
jgi:RNA polymerase sigma-70 factor, ECF subfamily